VRAASHIRAIKRPGDVILTIGGSAQALVSESHPELRTLEYSIGYRGITAPYRIFQSHIWRHVVHGFTGVDGGRDYDGVIAPWFDVDDFPFTTHPDPYVVYCGRFVHSKGIATVCDAAKHAGIKALFIGHGDKSLITYGEVIGEVSTADRNKILSQAQACLMPTQYIEPFGNVTAEAQLCGTPVISTDFGAFVESVEQGVSGFRCNTLGEFVSAIGRAKELSRARIRHRAQRLYGTDTAAAAYASYFERWQTVSRDGWRDLAPGLSHVRSPHVQQRGFDQSAPKSDPGTTHSDSLEREWAITRADGAAA